MSWEVIILFLALALGALLLTISSGVLGDQGVMAAIMSPMSELTAGAL